MARIRKTLAKISEIHPIESNAVLHIAVLVPAAAKSKTPPHGFPVDRNILRKSIKKVLLPSRDFKETESKTKTDLHG